VAPALRDLDHAGILTATIPELEGGRGFIQPQLHFYNVLDHNLATVAALDAVLGDGADGREFRSSAGWIDIEEALGGEIEGLPLVTLLRLACLLHDVAKPETATLAEDRLRFPRHGPRGAEIMSERLPLLGLGPGAVRFVTSLIRYHLRPGELIRAWPPSDHAVRRFATALDGHVLPLLLVNLCDGMATRGPRYTRENYRRHLTFLNYVVARAISAFPEDEDALLTGDDLIAELDVASGRLLGDVLASVRRAIFEGTVTSRDEALALAKMVLADLKAGA
jgi:hypothetical protein